MKTQFVVVEVAVGSVRELEVAIAQTLQIYGEPLRWAITAVDGDRKIVQVEAVVTQE